MAQSNGKTSVPPQHERLPPVRMWKPHALWAGILVVPFVGWLVAVSQTELPPGQCSGIGWGCSLAGRDAVGFVLILIGVPLLLVMLVGHLIIYAVQRIRAPKHTGSPLD